MKADKALIIKAAELGLLRSLENFLLVPIGPGRLKTRFEFVRMIVDTELAKIKKYDIFFFQDNEEEIKSYLVTLSDALNWVKGETHIGTMVSFCLSFLERSKSKYDKKLPVYLVDILDYYERANNITYRDIFNGKEFDANWKVISDMMGDQNDENIQTL